jgi:CRP/FNR family transcriptional regulator
MNLFYINNDKNWDAMVASIQVYNANCAECGLKKLCFPIGLDSSEVERLDQIVKRKSPLQKGDSLFVQGAAFSSIYAVRAGGFKVVSVTASGEDRILGFYLPGDILGADALATGQYVSSAVAFDTSSVCEIPYPDLEHLSLSLPALNHQLVSMISKELIEERMHAILLSRKGAEERVALFLSWLSQRQGKRGYSANSFRLGLLHRELAIYLGLTPETVSRVLAKLTEEAVLTWRNKQINILDSAKLLLLAGEANSALS